MTPERSDLSFLFGARSVAILGASRSETKISGRPIALLKAIGFDGQVFPVNPSAAEVQGFPAFASVSDLPCVPELAVISLPAHLVLDAVSDCATRGVKAAVIFTSGFREAGHPEAEAKMREIASGHGMRLLGPNCMGAFDLHARSAATFAQAAARARGAGGLSIVSQSGAVASYLFGLANTRHIGVSKWIATGNEVDISIADAIAHMATDAETRVIAAYLEGVPDGPALLDALSAAHAAAKQVVLMKVGRSVKGAAAVGTHTGALVGDDAVFDAAIESCGAIRAESFDEILDIAALCASGPFRKPHKVMIASISGGAGIIMADAVDGTGIDLPDPTPGLAKQIMDVLPAASTGNPLDTTAAIIEDYGRLKDLAAALAQAGQFDCSVSFLGTIGHSDAGTDAVIRAFAGQEHDLKHVLVLHANDRNSERLAQAGLVVIPDPVRAISALAKLVRVTTMQRIGGDGHLMQARPTGPLNEETAKAILAHAGLNLPKERVVRSEEEALSAFNDIGAPVVMKLVSPDIAHKSEIGGVILNIGSTQEARVAYEKILSSAAHHAPQARIDGVLVAQSVQPVAELIVGTLIDPTFGPVVMVGMGGIFAEIARDTRLARAPINSCQAHQMIADLSGFPLLNGARGRPIADVDAAAQTLSALSHFAAANDAWVASCEINPLAVLPKSKGAVALDALIVTRPVSEGKSDDLIS